MRAGKLTSNNNSAVFHTRPQASVKEVIEFKQNKTSIFNRIVHLEQFEEVESVP